MNFTTDALIKSIKRRAMLPDSDKTFSDTDILDMVDEELRYFAIPHLLSANEEFLVVHEDIPLEVGVLAYPIPYRAIGNKVRAIYIVDTSGSLSELTRIDVGDLSDYVSSSTHTVTAFYLENDKITFPANTVTTGIKLRIYYYLEPNKIVQEKGVGIITGIDTVGGVITLASFPSDFANLPDMDFIQNKNPNKLLKFDITPVASNKNAKTITFNPGDLPDSLVLGDHLAKAGETMVLQLPKEFQNIIPQRVAVQALEALGDEQNKVSAERRLEKMEKSLLQLVINRTESSLTKINPRRNSLKSSVSSRRKI